MFFKQQVIGWKCSKVFYCIFFYCEWVTWWWFVLLYTSIFCVSMYYLLKFPCIKLRFIFLAQFYIDLRSSCICCLSSLHMTFLLTLVSSAKLLSIHLCTFSSISEIIITNSIAAKTVPCGTPDVTSPSSDIQPLTTTLNFLLARNSLIHFPILHLFWVFYLF